MKRYPENDFIRRFSSVVFLAGAVLLLAACTKTINVYHPPRVDLKQFGRLGLITFSDNARPSVADYATEQFQNRVQSAQVGIPIVELGPIQQVLRSVGSNQLDFRTMQKIGKQYKVSAVFVGTLVYSDIKTDVKLKDIAKLDASVNTTLNATLSVKLFETDGGATIWSDSTAWKRKLGKFSVNEYNGVSVRTKGYEDAYQKLVPDMVQDVTRDFRGYYVRESVKK